MTERDSRVQTVVQDYFVFVVQEKILPKIMFLNEKTPLMYENVRNKILSSLSMKNLSGSNPVFFVSILIIFLHNFSFPVQNNILQLTEN